MDCSRCKEFLSGKVGDGKTINIWRHHWIPNSVGPLLHPEELNLSDYQYVAELIDEDNQSWKVELLQQLFTPDQVQQILTIPLDLTRKDKLVWPLTSTGHFTTKSAYNHLVMESQHNQPQQMQIPSTVWLQLWKLKIPYKLVHFLWKLLHNILPFRTRIFKIQSQQDQLCPLCHQAPETTTHLLLQCSVARAVWCTFAPQLVNITSGYNTIRDWILKWADKTSCIQFNHHETIHCTAYIMWALWKHRCDSVFWHTNPNALSITRHIEQYFQWQHLHFKLVTTNAGLQRRATIFPQWQPPPEGYFKINIDASMLPNCTIAGIAILIRDHAGRFVEAMGLLQHARNITQAEAWGFVHAMQWAHRCQYKKVMFENGNMQVVT